MSCVAIPHPSIPRRRPRCLQSVVERGPGNLKGSGNNLNAQIALTNKLITSILGITVSKKHDSIRFVFQRSPVKKRVYVLKLPRCRQRITADRLSWSRSTICGFSFLYPKAGGSRQLDPAVLLLKVLDRSADQIDDLAVDGAALVLRNVVLLVQTQIRFLFQFGG